MDDISFLANRELRSTAELMERLVETPMGIKKGQSILESKGWKEIVADIPGDDRKNFVAIMLENRRQAFLSARNSALQEDTTSIQVGNWEKFGFPVISMVAENLVTPDLVSVQPLQGPSGTVFFMDFTAGQTKGNIKKGDLIWDSRGGHGPSRDHSSEKVPQEQLSVQATGTFTYTGTLTYTPVRPGTVSIGAGAETWVDNGNGVIVASGTLNSGTIDYNSGAVSLVFGSVTNGNPILFTYEYNSESSTNLPQINFQLSSAPIYARRFALRGRWSMEAEQVLNSLHGLKAESSVSSAIASEIQFEIDREVLSKLWNAAAAGTNVWNATPLTGISFTEHKLTFVDAINELSGFIYRSTARVRANWVLTGIQGMMVLMNHPLFEPATAKPEVDGVTFLGTLNRMYKVYVDPHADPTSYLVGYKGNDWMRTGAIFAPWILLYSTQTIALDDMTFRKGFASSFGQRIVNGRYYAKGTITNYPTTFQA